MQKRNDGKKTIPNSSLQVLSGVAKWGSSLPCYGFMHEQKIPKKLKK